MMRSLLIFLSAGISISAMSQDFNKYYAIVYNANMPLSNKDLVDNISTRGGRFIYRELISNRFAAGGELGFATYQDRLPPQVYTNGNTSVFAELFPYVYNYTITISGEYYFTEGTWFKPFAGLGIGASYNRYTLYYNVFGDEDRVWGALFRPNAGVLARFGNKSKWAARISVHFDYATNKSEDFDYKSFTNVGADAGIALIIR